VVRPVSFLPAPLALLAVNVDAADRSDGERRAAAIRESQKPGHPVGGTLLAHTFCPFQDCLGFGLSDAAAHPLGCELQRTSAITNVSIIVPNPGDEPSPKVFGICGANVQRVPLNLTAPNGRQIEGTSLAALRLHAAALRLAKAMFRERTQLKTSREGSIGGEYRRVGQSPNFSLNLCAIQPGLYPRFSAMWVSMPCHRSFSISS
jgi:hypothetical protein